MNCLVFVQTTSVWGWNVAKLLIHGRWSLRCTSAFRGQDTCVSRISIPHHFRYRWSHLQAELHAASRSSSDPSHLPSPSSPGHPGLALLWVSEAGMRKWTPLPADWVGARTPHYSPSCSRPAGQKMNLDGWRRGDTLLGWELLWNFLLQRWPHLK